MFRKFWIRFITRLRRRDVETEMDDELRFHLDMQIEKNIERGMNAPEARRQAMLQFGGLQQVKEKCRDARIIRWLDETQRDLRYAFQSLRRKPGFALIVTLTLALGIGANTAIFSVVNCVLLRPLPYRNAERLVTLLRHTERSRDLISFISPADLEDFKSRSDVFEDAAVVLQTEYRVIKGESADTSLEVVGVVRDARQVLTLTPLPQFYRSYLQTPLGGVYLIARTSSSVPNLGKTLREVIQASDRRLVVGIMRTMEQATDRYFVNPRFYASLFGIFAAVALLLALVGIYGVMSYTVTQRTHEIGVRMAFGARARDILRLVIGQGMLVTSIGLAIGLAAGLALTHLLKKLVALYDVSATDPATFVAIAVLFAMTALPACYLPARRAMKVEPVIAVRCE